jgi:hypothetical protein
MIGTILFAALMMIAVGAVICLWGWQLPGAFGKNEMHDRER